MTLPPSSAAQDPRLGNPFWWALHSDHARFALPPDHAENRLARRYPADLLPFAALAEPSLPALAELAALFQPAELITFTDLSDAPPAALPQLAYVSLLPGLQMVLPPHAVSAFPVPSPQLSLRKLDAADAPAMVALTTLAFPGFFRRNTVQLGTYYGVHHGSELIAMAGERGAFPGFRELSAVCTHPAHRGHGHAATLMGCLARDHAAAGLCSILHVGAANASAIRLYEQLGFQATRPLFLHQLRRL